MKSGKKIGVKKFLILFLMMIAVFVIISQWLYSFYVSMFNSGMVTDIQMQLLGITTLTTLVTITVIVGSRYIWQIKSNSKERSEFS